MKYVIYKLNGSFKQHRWWKNSNQPNKHLPDINIETYIASKSLEWTELYDSQGNPAKFETINRTNINELEIAFKDIKLVPDYIKVTFTKADGTTESAYYYVDTIPNIYNSVNSLAVKVKYTLDKSASFYWGFHNRLISANPQMFKVRGHTSRTFTDSGTKTFDFVVQPELAVNNKEYTLISKNKHSITVEEQIESAISHLRLCTSTLPCEFRLQDNKLEWKAYGTAIWHDTFKTFITTEKYNSIYNVINSSLWLDTRISGNISEYIMTKAKGGSAWITPDEEPEAFKTTGRSFWLFPISRYPYVINDTSARERTWCARNHVNNLYEKKQVFIDDNIIGRFVTPLHPLALMLGSVISYTTDSTTMHLIFKPDNNYDANDTSSTAFKRNTNEYLLCSEYGVPDVAPTSINTYCCGLFGTSGDKLDFKINNNYFIQQLTNCIKALNSNTPYKTKENNPHIYSPNNFKLSYFASTNNDSTLTSDYIDLKYLNTNNVSLYFSTIITPEWVSRLTVNRWNPNKVLSQTANELSCNEVRQAPITCSAYNNTYLQRQVLDTGRNNQIKSGTVGITASVLSFITGALLTATGVGGPIGVAIAGAGITGIASAGINLSNGLAQNEIQRKTLLQQSATLNNPINSNGLTPYGTWAETTGLCFYTLGLSDMDANTMNADDNMYGYYVTKWVNYADYQCCWNGNYALYDMSRNYNNVYRILKQINSMFTQGDEYINEFIDSLNNGITWYDNGTYVDLATDVYNWERTYPKHS